MHRAVPDCRSAGFCFVPAPAFLESYRQMKLRSLSPASALSVLAFLLWVISPLFAGNPTYNNAVATDARTVNAVTLIVSISSSTISRCFDARSATRNQQVH